MRRLPALLAALALAVPSAARADAQADAAVEALRADSSLKVRTQAAIVLGQRGAASAVPALRRAVAEDGAPAVRIAAAAALAKLGARVARPTLRAAAQADADGGVRAAAARALETLGPVTLAVKEPSGTASAHAPAREALARHLADHGFVLAGEGEVRLEPTVTVEVAEQGGRTTIAVKAALVAVDGDGHLDLLEATSRAAVAGALTPSRQAAAAAKVVDAAVRGVCEDLAARLGGR
jgi:hypothetical protein